MSPLARRLLLSLGTTPVLLAACSLNPQPLPPGETTDGAPTVGGPADATTGDTGGMFASPDGAGGAADTGADTLTEPGIPDGSLDGGDGGMDAPVDSPADGTQDAPADAPASEEGG
jgi:hypothetical protein